MYNNLLKPINTLLVVHHTQMLIKYRYIILKKTIDIFIVIYNLLIMKSLHNQIVKYFEVVNKSELTFITTQYFIWH